MSTDQIMTIESAVSDLMQQFSVLEPPVPIELILRRPKEGMWQTLNFDELTGTFLKIGHRFSPRMSFARLLARMACRCDWGKRFKLDEISVGPTAEANLHTLARAILMPKAMLDTLPPLSRSPTIIELRFEVPEEDARQRLLDLGYLASGQ